MSSDASPSNHPLAMSSRAAQMVLRPVAVLKTDRNPLTSFEIGCSVCGMDIRSAWSHNRKALPPADEPGGAIFFWFYGYYQPPGAAGGA